MGADLIGIMLVGPQIPKFDPEQVKARARARQAKYSRWLSLLDPERYGSDESDQHGMPAVVAALDERVELDALSAELHSTDEFDAERVVNVDIDRLVQDTLDAWHGHSMRPVSPL